MVRNKPIYFALIAAVLLLRLNCWAQQPAAGTKLTERPTGAITGRVINSAGEPIPGATVSASSFTGTRSQTATVNANGEFKIDGLEPGLYRLFTGMTGYVFAFQPSPNDSPIYYRIGDSVTLTLVKGGVITGTVTGANGPLVGVGVFATRVQDEEGKKLTSSFPSRERSTDDRGVFRLYGLLPGAYILSAAKPRIGLIAPGAYDNDAPTYFPSSTRDTASEIIVRDGEEITADIQYRAEPGHAISGKVAGVVESQTQFSPGASITLIDVRDRTAFMNGGANSNSNFGFALYGIPDGEYELYASQYLPSRDELRSPPRRVTMRGADVTGINLTLGPLASIEGHVVFENDPKEVCAKRRETAAQETIVFGRRYEPEKKTDSVAKGTAVSDVSVSSINYVSSGVGDAKGFFMMRNLPSGSYRIDPRAPASGWYIRSITVGPATAAPRNSGSNVARDGVTLKSGERVSGLTVTITEGGASLRGRVSVAEGQRLPRNLRVYLLPAERENLENVLRFFEARAESDGSFAIGNIAPGRYWLIGRVSDESDPTKVKAIRQDPVLRAQVLKEAEGAKNEVSFQPCQRLTDYDLRYVLTPAPPKQ